MENEKKDGYLYTFGNTPAALILAEKLLLIDEKKRIYTLKVITHFFVVVKKIFEQIKDPYLLEYFLKLTFDDFYLKGCKHLTDEKTYLKNIMKVKIRDLKRQKKENLDIS